MQAATAHGARPTGGGGAAVAGFVGDTTRGFLQARLEPFDGRTLWEGAAVLRQRLAGDSSVPLALEPADKLALTMQDDRLRGRLASTVDMPEVANARDLCGHVRAVMMYRHHSCTGPASAFYTAVATHKAVELTLALLAERVGGVDIVMDRRSATTGATGRRLLPDFCCWVSGALLFKGEEAAEGEFEAAVVKLTSKICDVWAAGVVPGVAPPAMLAYAAAGTVIQFFCIRRDTAGTPHAELISGRLDLRLPHDRAEVLTASFNIWRLLAGYDHAKAGPPVRLPIAQHRGTPPGSGCNVILMGGFVRKAIKPFRKKHAKYASFELLCEMYQRIWEADPSRITQAAEAAAGAAADPSRHAVVQACDDQGPRLPTLDQQADEYVVHLAPVGVPCHRPPDTERALARAVHGVLCGLAVLHGAGFVHRDVHWRNVICLQAQDRWLLIDLEHAGREGCDCRREPYPLRHWTRRTLEADGRYTAASDLRMVAEQLLEDLPFRLSGQGKDLRAQLLGGGFHSAASALDHAWLSAWG